MSVSNEPVGSQCPPKQPITIQSSAYYLALLLLAIFVLYPRLSTGYTTQDDSDISLKAKSWATLLPFAWNFATSQGRFFGVFLILDLAVPYLLDNRLYYYSITIAAIVCNIACFYALMRLIFGSREVAVFTTALALAYLQNGWQHNPLTSYPFAYSIAMSCLLGSFISFYRWQHSLGIVSGLVTGALYLVALLTTEAFGTYCVIFFCLSVAFCWNVSPMFLRIKCVARIFLPIGVSLSFYAAFHIVFSIAYPSQYEGVQLATGSVSRIAAVVWQYGISTLPGYFYFYDSRSMAMTYDAVFPPVWGMRHLAEHLRVEWIAKTVILSWLCVSILRSGSAFVNKRVAGLLPLGLLAVFAPVTLVGLTIKYQRWVIDSHSLAGIHSYFAFFATIFVVSLLILIGKELIAPWRRLSAVYPFLVALMLAIPSLATDNYNYYIARDQQLSDCKWRMIDELAKTDELRAMQYGTLLYAPSLWEYRGIVENRPGYWSAYLTWRTGKKLTVCRTLEEFNDARGQFPQMPAYFLSFHQEPKEPNQFMVLARIPRLTSPEAGAVYANEATLFTFSENKAFVLFGRCRAEKTPIIRVNGEDVKEIDGDVFVHHVDQTVLAEALARTTIESTVPVDAAGLTISFFPVVPSLNNFTIEYGHGFYGLEKDDGRHLTWNWTSGNAEMSVWNRSGLRVNTCINLQLVTLTIPRTVTISANAQEQSVAFGGKVMAPEISIPMSLAPGETKIYFKTDRPGRPPGNGDPRPIAFAVQNARLCDVTK